ncbi:MAG: alpha/beta hydrolase [Rhodospirillales bacterium]|nr:alpha/beta hydrolase [Rhodospirillales bacterium]
MPEANIRGVHINYEIIGDGGPLVALTPGSRRSFDELVDLSEAVAADGYRVLLHDRRNCGKSDVVFGGSESEYALWADDLHALANYLGEEKLYVGGSSSGARLAILFAIRHAPAPPACPWYPEFSPAAWRQCCRHGGKPPPNAPPCSQRHQTHAPPPAPRDPPPRTRQSAHEDPENTVCP